MFLKSKFFRVICALSLLLALFSFVFGDTIRLKDGSIIKGKIINFTGGQFTVLIGEGSRQRRMNFYADEIESIEFDATSQPVATVKTNTQLPTKINNSNTSNNNSNTTVITVGQNTKPVATPTPIATPTPTVVANTNNNSNDDTIIVSSTNTTTNTNPTNNSTTTNTNPQPIQLKVKVLADNTANGWSNSGWVVRKGQKIRITSKGNISLGNGKYSSPNGISSLADKDKLMQQEATGGLIAVVGDDNNDFIFVGTDREFTATRDGSLFLGINEGNLDDNSGSFDVSIEIQPE